MISLLKGDFANDRVCVVPGCGHSRRYFIFFLLFVFARRAKNEQQLK
jgi:hypothetical protein